MYRIRCYVGYILFCLVVLAASSNSLTWPVRGYYGITSTFCEFRGMDRGQHNGIDVSVPDGTKVFAPIVVIFYL